MNRSAFITFEGPEGSGKSTQIGLLEERLSAQGINIVCTREPGGTALGESIRGLLQENLSDEPPCNEAELLLFSASRAELVRRVISPALDQGAWVLCDRFFDSTTVYQGIARGLGVERLRPVHALALGGRAPDLTIVLDLDVAAGMARVRARSAREERELDRIEREAISFHERVRDGFLTVADAEPDRFVVIDAMRTVEEIAEVIWASVCDRLGDRLWKGGGRCAGA